MFAAVPAPGCFMPGLLMFDQVSTQGLAVGMCKIPPGQLKVKDVGPASVTPDPQRGWAPGISRRGNLQKPHAMQPSGPPSRPLAYRAYRGTRQRRPSFESHELQSGISPELEGELETLTLVSCAIVQ
jgi:hypothetical protein